MARRRSEGTSSNEIVSPDVIRKHANANSSLHYWNSLNNFCLFCVDISKLGWLRACVISTENRTESVVVFIRRPAVFRLVLLTSRKDAKESARLSVSVNHNV